MVCADVAQSVERRLGKAEVTGPIPVISSREKTALLLILKTSFKISFDACFFSLATKRNSHNKKAFENAFAFLERGEND